MSARREYEMMFKLNGALGKDFTNSFRNASSEMKSLQSAMKNVNSTLNDINAFKRQESALKSNQERLEKLQKQHQELQEAMQNTANPSEQLRHQMERNERQIQTLCDTIGEQERKLNEMSDALEAAGVDTDNLSDSTDQLRKKYEQLGKSKQNIQELTDALDANNAKLKDATSKLGTMAGAYTAAIGAVYGATSKQAINFESAFAGVKKTVDDATPEQLAEIREGILELSQTDVIASAVEIAAVAEAAGQLGIQTENILSFSKAMIDLGESTNLASDEAASELAKFANITKMDQSEFSRLGSVIVSLGNNMATTEADIVSMGTRLAATGELTGLTEAQIMGVAATLSSLGIEAEAGGSAMSKFLKAFAVADATGNMEQYATVAGMTTEAFSALYKQDSLAAVSAFTQGLNDVERNGKSAIQILEEMEIKEVRLSNAILSMASSDGLLNKAVALANKAWEENNALTKEAEQRYSTTQSHLDLAANSAKNLGVTLGDMTLPYVRNLSDEFTESMMRAQRWATENEDTIISAADLTLKIGGAALALKGLQVTYLALHSGGLLAAKGLAKVGSAIVTTSFAAKGAKLSTFMTSLTGLSASATGFLAVGAGTVAVLAAITAAVWANNKAVNAARKEYADGLLFENGLPSLEEYTEALQASTAQSYAFAQEINATADQLNDIATDVSMARSEVELYGYSLRENGTLTPEEAAAMREPFNNLVSSLEEDFTVRYTAVFDAFKLAASDVATELGVDIATISGVLDTFKNKYTGSLDESQAVVDELLGNVSDGGSLSSEELATLQSELAYINALSADKSENLYNYEQTAAAINGMDLGGNQEEAIRQLQELQTYASEYLAEIDEAQNNLNRYYDDLRAKASTQLEYGKITQQEYDDFTNSLNLAQGVTYESYIANRNDFTSQNKELAASIINQIDDAIIESVNSEGLSFWDSYIGTLSAYGNFFTGKGFTNQMEDARSNAINSTRKMYEDLIAEVNTLNQTANIAPIQIPVEYVDAVHAATAANKASTTYDPANPFGLAQYAVGTSNAAPGLALVGEEGPELVNFNGGERVYTAEETKSILNADGGGISVTIHQNVTLGSGTTTSMVEEMNDDLVDKIQSVIASMLEDRRRNAYA